MSLLDKSIVIKLHRWIKLILVIFLQFLFNWPHLGQDKTRTVRARMGYIVRSIICIFVIPVHKMPGSPVGKQVVTRKEWINMLRYLVQLLPLNGVNKSFVSGLPFALNMEGLGIRCWGKIKLRTENNLLWLTNHVALHFSGCVSPFSLCHKRPNETARTPKSFFKRGYSSPVNGKWTKELLAFCL